MKQKIANFRFITSNTDPQQKHKRKQQVV